MKGQRGKPLCIVVDGGGTNTRVHLYTTPSSEAHDQSLVQLAVVEEPRPSNPSTTSLARALASVKAVLERAVAAVPPSLKNAGAASGWEPRAWVALAGVESEGMKDAVRAELRAMMSEPHEIGSPRSTIDIDVVLSALAPEHVATSKVTNDGDLFASFIPSGTKGIVLLAGTGSCALAYEGTQRLGKLGGWGPHLGDQGSGYALGRRAVATVLEELDLAPSEEDERSKLAVEVLHFYRATTGDELLDAMYVPSASSGQPGTSLLPTLVPIIARLAASCPKARAVISDELALLARHRDALAERWQIDPHKGTVVHGGGIWDSDVVWEVWTGLSGSRDWKEVVRGKKAPRAAAEWLHQRWLEEEQS